VAGRVQDFKASPGAMRERHVRLSHRQKALEFLDFSLPISFFLGYFSLLQWRDAKLESCLC